MRSDQTRPNERLDPIGSTRPDPMINWTRLDPIRPEKIQDFEVRAALLTTTVLWTISENGDKKRQWPYPEDIFWGPRGLQSCMQVRKKLVPISQPRKLILKIQQMIW